MTKVLGLTPHIRMVVTHSVDMVCERGQFHWDTALARISFSKDGEQRCRSDPPYKEYKEYKDGSDAQR